MSVDPLKSPGLSQADAGRIGASASPRRPDAAATSETPAESPASPADRVQLSAASRSLHEQADAAGAVPHGTLDPERLREVLRRLSGEFYQGAEVRNAVAAGVRRDLGLTTTE
jgi:hypothetical protein